jgi:hypothetical protein
VINLNALQSLPPRPLTDVELATIDTTDWKRYSVKLGAKNIDRFQVDQNATLFWKEGNLCFNITPQSKPLDAIHAIFYRDLEDGTRMIQPIEIVPTNWELEQISQRRATLSEGRVQ